MTDPTTDAAQVLRAYNEMWNDGETSRISEVVSQEFTVYNPTLPEGEVRGHDGLAEWMQAVRTAFPDFHVEILDMLTSDDTIMVEVNYTMTHEGEFQGVPPTGREVDLTAMAKFRVEDGTLLEHRDYLDRQSFFEQLGVADQ